MRKSIIVLVLLLAIVFSSTFSYANNLNTKGILEKSDEVEKMVLVGFARVDKEELFGNLSDEEVDKLINEMSLDILKSDTISIENVERKYSTLNKDKLIISISDKKTTRTNGTTIESLSLDEINPNAYDEEQVAKILDYWIQVEMKSGVILTSAYSTIVQGIVNKATNKAHIENLITKHIYGGYFPGYNYGLGTSNAWIVFVNTEMGFVSFCRADFKISNTGKISLAGTVQYQ